MIAAKTNVPVEIPFAASKASADCSQIELDVIFTGPRGREWRVPAFWAGDNRFGARFAAPEPGAYTYRSICVGPEVDGLHGQIGEIEASAYDGDNPLYKHGRLKASASGRGFEHSDGTPFFWLADTWWMGLTTRLDWPAGFAALAQDRVEKGFNAIQTVAGPLPNFDAVTESWHPEQLGDGGWPWKENWAGINPEFYNLADRRIQHLVESGLMPCIVGMWGYYIGFMGVENAKKHWRNLVARYGAYPVTWCAAGEVGIPTYSSHGDKEAWDREMASQARTWAEVARYIGEIDPYPNMLTTHPWVVKTGRTSLDDLAVLSFDMLQTGHGGHNVLKPTLEAVEAATRQAPRIPVLNGEPCYEGILGTAWQEMQRFVFWTSVVTGAAGHTYGAQGIWQMSTSETPYSQDWGRGFWKEAMHYAGSAQMGVGRKLVERYPWWLFEPREIAATKEAERASSFAIGKAGVAWLFYLPAVWVEPALAGVQGMRIDIEPGIEYRAVFLDPRTGAEVDGGAVVADADGTWPIPSKPTNEDWVLVIQNDAAVENARK